MRIGVVELIALQRSHEIRESIPADRRPTLSIAPQSVAGVYWSQPDRVGGDGFANFEASL